MLVSVNTQLGFFQVWLRTFYFIPVDMFATYVTIYYLLPKFLIVKKYLMFAFLFIVLAFITIFLNQFVRYFIYIPIYFPDNYAQIDFFEFDMYVWLASTYVVVIFAGGIKISKLWLNEQKAKARLENEQTKSELMLLKSQMNPHFIFNTLNNIDTLIHTNPQMASQSIIRLSEIMRYVTYEATADFVSVKKEINYLQSFIEIQKLRLGNEFFSVQIENKNPEKKIAPMLFIPLVENAIKHGDKKSKIPGIEIKINIDEHIMFTVLNYLPKTSVNKDHFGGIGLKNLIRRLELIYPDSHSFECTTNHENQYTAQIWIQ